MKKLLILIFVLFAPLALAQDIANHSMPVGGGPGAVGWKTAGPCSFGQVLVWSSVNADPACGSVPASGAVNPQAASYAAQPSDCGGIISMTANAQDTITVGAIAGFTAPCTITIQNASATRGKTTAVSGLTVGNRNVLYPKQSFTIAIINSAWQLTVPPGRWRLPAAATLFVNNSSGSNSNDGLASGAAFNTILAAITSVCDEFDVNTKQVTVQLTFGQNYLENLFLCNYTGGGTPAVNPPIILGDATSTTTAQSYVINGSGSFTVLGVGLSTPWVLKGLTLVSVGSIALEADYHSYIYGQSICFSTATTHMTVTYGSSIEFLQPGFDCIAGAASAHINLSTGGQVLYQAGVNINHLAVQNYAGAFLTGTSAGIVTLTGVTYTGTATGNQCALVFGAGVDTSGNLASIPGTGATCTATSPAWKN